MKGFTARWILECWPRLDLVVNRAPHCGHTCGFVSSKEEFLLLRDLGLVNSVMGVSRGEETGEEEKTLFGLSLWLRVKGFLVSPGTARLAGGGPGPVTETGAGKAGNMGLLTGAQQPVSGLIFSGGLVGGSKDLLKKIAFFSCCDRTGGGL